MSFTLRPVLSLLAMATLTACSSMNTPYQTPAVTLPTQWQDSSSPGTQAAQPLDLWWHAFDDPALNTLIEQALARNNDLAAATLKLRRAQLQAGLAADQLNPTLGGSVGYSVESGLRRDAGTTRGANARLEASWELDLWNKLGNQRNAADWEARASAQDKESTALSLTGSTARLYWQLGYLAQRIRQSDASLAYAQRTLDLVRAQRAAGAATGVDVLQAEQSLASQQASHTQLLQQRREAQTALALLFDGDAPAAAAPLALPAQSLPPVDAGLPASLLGRRPDLRAAELRLRSTLATADATRAALYPSLSLTGSLGSSSDSLRHVLLNPATSLAATLSLPFLQWNERQLNIRVAQTDYALAVTQFRQTLYTALGDVDNALAARSHYTEQAEALTRSLAAAREVERLDEVRYRAGAITLQTWLDAQEKRRTAENALAENQYNRLSNHVTLVLALGGGTAPTP